MIEAISTKIPSNPIRRRQGSFLLELTARVQGWIANFIDNSEIGLI